MLSTFRLLQERFLSAPPETGAYKAGGRWNKVRESAVYSSGSISLAALEILANVSLLKGIKYCVLEFSIPSSVSINKVSIKDLPKSWRTSRTFTEEYGSRWLSDKKSCILQVPSAVNPHENNYIINPTHPDYTKIKVSKPKKFSFDNRLLIP
ncbi:MAG: RES domain-containing protein [Candidatus Omnitrophota bacterium]|jgi:RES domain-containing protein